MIFWQIGATKSANKIDLTMRLMEQYDSMQMRENRKALALILEGGDTLGARAIETVLDILESISLLHRRKLVDTNLIENAFSVPIRYWWCALESDIKKMRNEYHDITIYEEFEQLAIKYNQTELTNRRVSAISQTDLKQIFDVRISLIFFDEEKKFEPGPFNL